MKTLLPLMIFHLLSATALLAEDKPVAADKPKVEVYLIRKDEVKEGGVMRLEAMVLELSNPTDQTYYVYNPMIEHNHPETQVKREEKWYVLPSNVCATGSEFFPFKPGAKMLATVIPPEEEAVRFQFYFYTTDDHETAKVVTATSREILRKEFSDSDYAITKPTVEELEEPMSDEEMNKKDEGDEAARDPFAK
ncbi:MAG: hypothetical protein EOP87_23230 [Verrucomicrobiaceae bacterium]|nr:MAG: hypothetical protein EOP87_23230 [Verrucomicrobiaceae bacterium]